TPCLRVSVVRAPNFARGSESMIETGSRLLTAPGSTPLAEEIRSGRVTRDLLGELIRQMAEIRAFEDKIYELYRGGALKGASHLSAGQEAVPVGAISTLSRRDLVASTHRGHGHC